MAIATVFCMSGAVIAKAGFNVHEWISGGVLMGNAKTYDGTATDFAVDEWIQEAESVINVMTRYNWTDVYATLNDDVKYILREAAANLAAINCIMYDMSGYTSRVEAEDLVNTLRDAFLRDIAILREVKARDFVNAA